MLVMKVFRSHNRRHDINTVIAIHSKDARLLLDGGLCLCDIPIDIDKGGCIMLVADSADEMVDIARTEMGIDQSDIIDLVDRSE